MDPTASYYEQRASEFFASTVSVDMSPLYDRFLHPLQPGASLLDAGCGSGRDAKEFARRGYKVTAFDASPQLASLASQHCGFDVAVRTFSDVNEITAFDGIWCCASLLHVPRGELPAVVAQLWRALRPGGVFYLSFKLGQGERQHDGRHFTDMDEDTVRGLFLHFSELQAVETWITADQRPGRNEQWVNAIVRRSEHPTHRLITGGRDPFLPHLSRALAGASSVELAVAFVKVTGLRLLMADLLAALPGETETVSRRQVRILTSDYLDVTDPEALRLLLLLQARGADVKVFTTGGSESFHLKAYIFARVDADHRLLSGTAFIGSSNISRQALEDGLEWNYRVTYPHDEGFLEARHQFEKLFHHPNSLTLSHGWIEDYEKRRIPPPRPVAPGSSEREPHPEPNDVQRRALQALEASRAAGYRRGLVVLATGLGKTWLAAFDTSNVGARRILFVAHREEILSQAAETFLKIRPHARVGYYMGQTRDADVDVLCASIQTLSRAQHLEKFSPQHFDYIVIDEFHHASAQTYRKLLRHFAPNFLLGLTATPDRTDQSDILTLCDDNLVYTVNLFDGIQAGLLAPFHYYGIHDEHVDYREIPWRNGRFDPEQLSNKLATLARARHALKEWRRRAQSRTLAFCVSKRHADYMADQFQKAGIAAAAVYTGSTMGRAEALDALRKGDLQVIFSVDFFNEGVDLPAIDTVMMLRPSESKILFLQQLGRGLRRSEGKDRLVVMDFIGNHQAFLHKLPALFGVGSTYHALAKFARQVETGRLELPDGCFVNYDLSLIDFLKALDSNGPSQDYESLRSSLGRRPTLAEFYRSGASVSTVRRQHGGWFEFVHHMQDLTPAEAVVLDACAALLREIEVAQMVKSYKMILLEAFLELDGLRNPPDLKPLAERSWLVLRRRGPLAADLPEERFAQEDGQSLAWQSYWQKNPIDAWIGANRPTGSASFSIKDNRFTLRQTIGSELVPALAPMLQELVDYRLASYETRTDAASVSNVVPFVPKKSTSVELPYFPNLRIACGHFRAGSTDSEEHRTLPPSYGNLDPARHFIARASGNSMNGGKHPIKDGDYLLLEHVTATNAGGITGSVMAIERDDAASDDEQYVLRVVLKDKNGQYVLRANNPEYEDFPATDEMRTRARLRAVIDPLDMALGQTLYREDIPPLFGEEFNPGNWNSGHVVLGEKKIHVLLVTLDQRGKARQQRFHNYWVDEKTFHWESQKSTTPESKRGREVIDHGKRGIDIHLFVRDSRLSGTKAAPFFYHGKVRYQSHSGSEPMRVVFKLDSAD